MENITEAERREVAAKIETFPVQWTSEHIKQLIALPFVKFDDVDKFRGCYLLSKEDPSVFVTPFFCADDEDNAAESTNACGRWGRIDTDYAGFCFAPKALMDPYKEDRSNTKLSGELFCHMANYVARNHGHETEEDLVPSSYLDLEVTSDQVKLLNPTARHAQIGAIRDQCVGVTAKKVLAKRRIDMASGNISSYARVLNGPHQLEKIQTFNELAVTMTTLKKEREQAREEASARKKQEEKDKAARRAEKEMEAINKQ